MIMVCKNLESRLDKVWYRLQRLEQEKAGGHISQIDLDEACVKRLEDFVTLGEHITNLTKG